MLSQMKFLISSLDLLFTIFCIVLLLLLDFLLLNIVILRVLILSPATLFNLTLVNLFSSSNSFLKKLDSLWWMLSEIKSSCLWTHCPLCQKCFPALNAANSFSSFRSHIRSHLFIMSFLTTQTRDNQHIPLSQPSDSVWRGIISRSCVSITEMSEHTEK